MFWILVAIVGVVVFLLWSQHRKRRAHEFGQFVKLSEIHSIAERVNPFINSQDIDVEDNSPGANAEELLINRVAMTSAWIANEAYQRCSPEEKSADHFAVAAITTAIIACGCFIGRGNLDFEGTTLETCAKLSELTEHAVSIEMMGKAISVNNSMQFRAHTNSAGR